MILDFRHKGLAQLYKKANRKGLSTELVPKAERILARLDIASTPEMMNLPGLRLHPLKGKWHGFWSVWVSENWRIIFRFEGSNATDIDLVDYH